VPTYPGCGSISSSGDYFVSFLVWSELSFCLYEQISCMSGATVATRGRYLSQDELSRAEPGYVADN